MILKILEGRLLSNSYSVLKCLIIISCQHLSTYSRLKTDRASLLPRGTSAPHLCPLHRPFMTLCLTVCFTMKDSALCVDHTVSPLMHAIRRSSDNRYTGLLFSYFDEGEGLWYYGTCTWTCCLSATQTEVIESFSTANVLKQEVGNLLWYGGQLSPAIAPVTAILCYMWFRSLTV